jgi:hypothetical protein
MRADLAPLITSAIFLFAGFGVLAAAGLLRRTAWGVLAATGLAYLVGVASVMLVAIALLCLGIALGLAGYAALAALIGATGLAVAALRRPKTRDAHQDGPRRWAFADLRQSVGEWGAEQWLACGFVVAIAVYAVFGYAAASLEPLDGWDAMSIWSRKALLLTEFGKPTADFFQSSHYVFMHLDYPILLPVYESVFFRAAGSPDVQVLHAQLWLFFVFFLWAAAFLAARVARPLVWAPLIAVIAVTPSLSDGIRTLGADVPMSLFLGLGVLLVGLWLADGRRGDLAVGTILLAAAANTKNEGLVAAFGVLAVAAIVAGVAGRRDSIRRATVPVVAALAVVALAVAPWRLWVAAHPVAGDTADVSVSKGLDPVFIIHHADRIQPTVSAIGDQVSDPGRWLYLLPLMLAISVAAFRIPTERRLVAFYLGAGLTVFASLVIWGYVINDWQIDELITFTVDRTVDGMMLVAVAGLLHLSGRALPPGNGPGVAKPR